MQRRSVVILLGLVVALVGGSKSGTAQSRDITVEEMRGEKRVALVIGNSAYTSSSLRNPVNDARAMAASLRHLGFEVLAYENLGEKTMRRAINEFGDRLARGGVGLFFFAGHGVQVGGKNFIVPVDAAIRTERDVEIEAVDVARVLARMDEAKNRLNIVVLDACRDNPFGRSLRSATRGLAQIDAPSGTLLAYATAPGKVARDGDGTHGLYTGELLKAIRVPGLKVEDVFKRVRREVQRQTRGEQVPWEASSLVGDFIFALPGFYVAAVEPPQSAPPQSGLKSETLRFFTEGVRLQRAGQYAQAIEQYEKAIAAGPTNLEALNNLGVLLKETGRLDQAAGAFQRALTLDPKYEKALNNLGVVRYLKGQYEEAIGLFRRAIIINPENVESYINLGITYLLAKSLDEARVAFERAVQLDARHAEAHYNLALLYERQELWSQAVSHYEQFLQLALPKHGALVAKVQERLRLLAGR